MSMFSGTAKFITGDWSGAIGDWNNDLTGTSAQNAFNAQQAEISRNWQEQMSNTAYQRGVADLKAAGLNPASLSGDGHLSPASTPSGATAAAGQGGGNTIGDFIKGIAKVAMWKVLSPSIIGSAVGAKSPQAITDRIMKAANSATMAAKKQVLTTKPSASGNARKPVCSASEPNASTVYRRRSG